MSNGTLATVSRPTKPYFSASFARKYQLLRRAGSNHLQNFRASRNPVVVFLQLSEWLSRTGWAFKPLCPFCRWWNNCGWAGAGGMEPTTNPALLCFSFQLPSCIPVLPSSTRLSTDSLGPPCLICVRRLSRRQGEWHVGCPKWPKKQSKSSSPCLFRVDTWL